MKTVGIVTMHQVLNCGSILQAYATQRAIADLGHQAEIIDYTYPNARHCKRPSLKVQAGKYANNLAKGVLAPGEFGRFRQRFRDFMRKEVKLSRPYADAASIEANPPMYDVYVTGSDQVWNPDFVRDDQTFFLGFAPQGRRRISYASSFGRRDVPENLSDTYRRYLNGYDQLGVREASGVDLIKRLTGKEARLVLDPTLLLTAEAWGSIASAPAVDGPYILCYGLDRDDYTLRLARRIREMTGYRIVRMYGLPYKRFTNRDIEYVFDAGPLEFLGLFRNAAFTIARSFHGTIFSLMFSRPFLSVHRGEQSMADSRQVSLLRLLGLEDCGIMAGATPLGSMPKPIDYAIVQKTLSDLRRDSLGYLRTAIGG